MNHKFMKIIKVGEIILDLTNEERCLSNGSIRANRLT